MVQLFCVIFNFDDASPLASTLDFQIQILN